MKHTMSPSRAYLLGLWKGRRTKEGVGVEGRGEICDVFLKACFDEKFAQPDRVQIKELEMGITKCFFYNTSIRNWLQDEFGKRSERLRFKNEFAASYFAGVFDSKGGFIEFNGKKIPYFFGDRTDEMVLLRLGFRTKRERGKIAVFSSGFYEWISGFLKIYKKK